MIFHGERYAARAQALEWSGDAPRTLDGPGVWVCVLSSGSCLANGRTGRSGDLLLARGTNAQDEGESETPVLLTPDGDGPCHLLAVRLTGLCAEELAAAVAPFLWADSAACPQAAELAARLAEDTDPESRLPYALLAALAHADEPVHTVHPLVAEALAAIRNNYGMLYGVEELSEQLGVSKCHLVRLFTAEMGVGPGKYLTQTRIEAAKTLLMGREYTLDTIAGLCGFSGANYFCRVFKKTVGVTPAAWRAAAVPGTLLPDRPALADEAYL